VSRGLDGKAFAACGATALEDESASVSGHARHKAMDATALHFFGLECSFGHSGFEL
jgi:hypothetical protein